jgi:hypothetical protein
VPSSANALRWDRQPGHYEVYYLTVTDPASGVGLWIRYTMLAPVPSTGEPPSCALWFLAMDPRPGKAPTFGRKATLPIDQLQAREQPFELRVGDAELSDEGMTGAFEDVAWELHWTPAQSAYEHVHPVLQRLGVAKTVLVLPHADLSVSGTVSFASERLELAGARGGQAHLWGSKHAASWAWVHCNDFSNPEGKPVPGAFVDGVSVFVPRFGREIGPNTPLVARVAEEDVLSTSPLRVATNKSEFGLSTWRFEAVAGRRKLIGQVDAARERLAGVTYHDPDGELVYCYNTETASMRLDVYERGSPLGGWAHSSTLVSSGRAHFEHGQRTPVPGIELHTT